MNASPRAKLLSVIAELGEVSPDRRFGQLIANLQTSVGEENGLTIWDTEDVQLLVAAQRLLEPNRERLAVKH